MTSDLGHASRETDPTPQAPASSLSELLIVHVHPEATHHWAEVRLPAANRASAARRVAIHIASQRCGGAPQYFDAWLARHNGGPLAEQRYEDYLKQEDIR